MNAATVPFPDILAVELLVRTERYCTFTATVLTAAAKTMKCMFMTVMTTVWTAF